MSACATKVTGEQTVKRRSTKKKVGAKRNFITLISKFKFFFIIPVRSGENLLHYRLHSSPVIMASILIIPLFYKALIFQRQNFMLMPLRA